MTHTHHTAESVENAGPIKAIRRRCTHCKHFGPERFGVFNADGKWFCSVGCRQGERYERGANGRAMQLATQDADRKAEEADVVAKASGYMRRVKLLAMPMPEPYVRAERPQRIVFGEVPLLVAADMIVRSGPGFKGATSDDS